MTFSNVIGYSNRDADKQVVITAHFDSKLYPAGDRVFLAAVDSAVPVAMILSVMDNLNELLQNKKQDKNKVKYLLLSNPSHVGINLVFGNMTT